VQGISAVVVDGLDQSFAAGVARLVLVGEGGMRLHEEVFLAGTRLSRRQELGIDRAEELLASTLDGARLSAPGEGTLKMLTSRWNTDGEDEDGVRARVGAAIQSRAETRRQAVESELASRRNADLATVDAIFERFASTLRGTLDAAEDQRLAGEQMLFAFDDELKQRERDLERVRTRLATLGDERRAERESVERRYRDVKAHVFVAALVFALTPDDVKRLETTGGR
jgi:hypothetical protein